MSFKILLFLFFVLTIPAQKAPEKALAAGNSMSDEIIKNAQINSAIDAWHYLNEYTIETEVLTTFEGSNRRVSNTYEYYCYWRACLQVQTKRNSKALPNRKIAKERVKIAREIELGGRSPSAPPEQRSVPPTFRQGFGYRIGSAHINPNFYLAGCQLDNPQKVRVENRDALRYEFSNCDIDKLYSGAQNRNFSLAHMIDAAGYLYLDMADERLIKLDSYKQADFALGRLSDPLLQIEMTKVPAGFWFWKRIVINGIGNETAFSDLKNNLEMIFVDYKRYHTEADAQIEKTPTANQP